MLSEGCRVSAASPNLRMILCAFGWGEKRFVPIRYSGVGCRAPTRDTLAEADQS